MNKFFINKKESIAITLAGLASVLLVSGIVYSSTISTDISTGGTLTVSGATTLSGAATLSSTLGVTGLTSMIQASSTRLSVHDTAYFGGTATSSFTSAGVLTLQNGETITNSTDGTIALTAATTTLSGDLLISPNGRIYVHPTLTERETGSYINQAIKADVTLGSTFGASDTSDEWFGAAIRSRLMGSNLTGANNTVGALEGSYQITGTNASVYPKGAVLGEIGGNSTTADGAFVAYTDGDVGTLNSAGAAFKVMNNNNAASNSKFTYGLDLFDAGHAGLAPVTFGTADIRLVNGETISNSTNGVITLGGAALLNRTATSSPTADATLTAAQSGTTFFMGTAGLDLTLPAIGGTSGVWYRFVDSTAVDTTNMTVVAPANLLQGPIDVNSTLVLCTSEDLISFVQTADVIGDWVEVRSDGTNWFVTGQAQASGGITCD